MRERTGAIVAGVAGLLLLLASAVGLASAQAVGQVRQDVAAGIPVTLYAAPDGTAAPTVIVAHGFSGSAQMMEPLASGLNRAGFTVVTFDFPGHGANAAPLVVGPDARGADTGELLATLREVVDWTAVQPEVDRARLALLGHSMGALAVTDYATADAVGDGRISGTVSLSLPSAQNIPGKPASVPRNLLLLYGSLEQDAFAQASLDAVQAAYPEAVVGTTYGDSADGTARKAQEIPNVEHITILFSDTTLQASATWLGLALGMEPASTSLPPVLLYALLALIGGGLVLVPIGKVALGPAPGPVEGSVRGWHVLVVAAVAAVIGTIGAWVLGPLQEVIPLAVGGYLATWFACAGGFALAWWVITRRSGRRWPTVTWRSAIGAVVVTAVAVAVVVVPGSLTWATFALVGPRWWLVLLMVTAFGLYFSADELLVRRTRTWSRFGLTVVSRLLAVGAILAAIPILQAPGFLILVMPVLLLFLLVLAWYAAVVGRCRNGYLAAVAIQALPAAVLVATVFPLLG